MRTTFVLKALEPISHGDTLTGVDNSTNIRLFMRSSMFVNGIPTRVPDISENSLRTVMFRKPLAEHLLSILDIETQSLSKGVVNLLFSGGNLASGAKAPSQEQELSRGLKKFNPLLDLLGGAVDTFILPAGRMKITAWPISKEFTDILSYVAPNYIVEQSKEVSIFDCISEEVRTRGTGKESTGNQMLYTYETLAAGTRFFVEITLDINTSDLTKSCTKLALELWNTEGGFFGGQGRQGRGRTAIDIVDDNLIGSDLYIAFLQENKQKIKDGLIAGDFTTGKLLCV